MIIFVAKMQQTTHVAMFATGIPTSISGTNCERFGGFRHDGKQVVSNVLENRMEPGPRLNTNNFGRFFVIGWIRNRW